MLELKETEIHLRFDVDVIHKIRGYISQRYSTMTHKEIVGDICKDAEEIIIEYNHNTTYARKL